MTIAADGIPAMTISARMAIAFMGSGAPSMAILWRQRYGSANLCKIPISSWLGVLRVLGDRGLLGILRIHE